MIDETRTFFMKFQAGYVAGNIYPNEVINECNLLCTYLSFIKCVDREDQKNVKGRYNNRYACIYSMCLWK